MSLARWILIYLTFIAVGAVVGWFSSSLVNHDMACKQDTYLTPQAGTPECK